MFKLIILFVATTYAFSDIYNDDFHVSNPTSNEASRLVNQIAESYVRNLTGKVRRDFSPSCRRLPWTVNFYEIGMKYILSPGTLEIGYCKGDCSALFIIETNRTNSALIRSLMNEDRANSPKVNTPCCVPSDYLPTSLQFIENGQLVTRFYRQLVVKSCSCQ